MSQEAGPIPNEVVLDVPLAARVYCPRCHGCVDAQNKRITGAFADPAHLSKHLKKQHPGDTIGFRCAYCGYRGKSRYPQKDVKAHIAKVHPGAPVAAEPSPATHSDAGADPSPSSATSAAPPANTRVVRAPPTTTSNPRQPGARSSASATARARTSAARSSTAGPSTSRSSPPTRISTAPGSPTYAAVTAGPSTRTSQRPPRTTTTRTSTAAGAAPRASTGAVPKRLSLNRAAAKPTPPLTVVDLATPPSSEGVVKRKDTAGSSSGALRRPPPPSPSSAGSFVSRGGVATKITRSPGITPAAIPPRSRATGASSGAARPARAHPRSPQAAGSSALPSAAGGAERKRTSAVKSPPPSTQGGVKRTERTSGASDAKSSVSRPRLALIRKRPGDDARIRAASRGSGGARVSPPAKSLPISPVASTSTGAAVAPKPAAATSRSTGGVPRGVLSTSPPLRTSTSPPVARAPIIVSDVRVSVPLAILKQYVPATSLPTTVTTTTVTTTTCGGPVMATGFPPAGRVRTPPVLPAPPVVVDVTNNDEAAGHWTPAPGGFGFAEVLGEGAWRATTPPQHHQEERQPSPPTAAQRQEDNTTNNSGGFEILAEGGWSVSRGRKAGRRRTPPSDPSACAMPAASGSRSEQTPPPLTPTSFPPLPLPGVGHIDIISLDLGISVPLDIPERDSSDEGRSGPAEPPERRDTPSNIDASAECAPVERRRNSPVLAPATRGRNARVASGSSRGGGRGDRRVPQRPAVPPAQPPPEQPPAIPVAAARQRRRARLVERDVLIGRAAGVATVAELEDFAAQVAEYFSRDAAGPGDRPDAAGRPVGAGSERPRRGAGRRREERDGANRGGQGRQGNRGDARADWVREAARIQALYRSNRRRAVREVLRGPSEFCQVQKDRVHGYFAELYRGNLPLDGAGDDAERNQPLEAEDMAFLTDPFSEREVDRRLRRVSNSAPGPDGITYKDLREADPGARLLCAVFNICLRLEVVPACWKNSNTVLVYKKGDKNDIENWRPLAMGDTMPKLFAAVVADRLTDWAIRREMLSPAQKGFLRDEGCHEHNFVLQEILTDARRSRREVVVAWLDLSNAFGSVPHDTIRRSLTRAGVPARLINIWADMYTGCTTRVRAADGWTAPIPVCSGVKQGCPLSPIIFDFAIDPVIRAATDTGAGYEFLDRRWSTLAYADDIALIAETPEQMQRLLTAVETEARSRGLRFNPSKCATLHIRAGRIDRVLPTAFEVQGERVRCLAEGEPYAHLGVPTGASVDQNPYSTLGDMMEDMRRVEDSLLAPWQRVEVVATNILPRLDFLLRGAKVEKGPLKVADKEVRRLAKTWLNLPQRASAEVVYLPPNKGGCGLLPLADLADVLTVAHVFRVLTANDVGVRDLAWASLGGVVRRRIGTAPSGHDIASFLSGSLEGRLRDGGERSLWSDARNAARRQASRLSLRWRWVDETGELLLECRGAGGDTVKIPPGARAQVVGMLRSAVVHYHTHTLLAKKDQGKVHEVAMRHGVSNHFMRTGSFTRFADWRFIHRARLDVLPLNGARRWGMGDTRCRRCGGSAETLPHVLNHCGVHADAIQLRHDDLLLRLEAASRLPGEVRRNQRVEGVGDEFADLRPDLVVRHEASKSIVIVDVTVPFENRRVAFDEARARKVTKYSPLAEALTRQGYRVVVTAFVVGSLGAWCPRNEAVLKLLRVSRKYAAMMRRLMVSDTIRWSRDIYVEHVSGVRQYNGIVNRGPDGALRANARAVRRRWDEREMAIAAHRGLSLNN